ncbi:MAG: hypothetical protein WA477_05750, partial [Candidatus Sulfotelmatobacter sp.]
AEGIYNFLGSQNTVGRNQVFNDRVVVTHRFLVLLFAGAKRPSRGGYDTCRKSPSVLVSQRRNAPDSTVRPL